jgi:hypothetical protein
LGAGSHSGRVVTGHDGIELGIELGIDRHSAWPFRSSGPFRSSFACRPSPNLDAGMGRQAGRCLGQDSHDEPQDHPASSPPRTQDHQVASAGERGASVRARRPCRRVSLGGRAAMTWGVAMPVRGGMWRPRVQGSGRAPTSPRTAGTWTRGCFRATSAAGDAGRTAGRCDGVGIKVHRPRLRQQPAVDRG